MRKWVRSFTYAPKIPAVRDDRCKQTIRHGHTVEAGDIITWHGWEGRPYRSKWSWRKTVTVKEVFYVHATKDGMWFPDGFYKWEQLDWLAKRDFIDPPTGKAMGELFNSKYDLTNPFEMQIICW